MTQNLNPEINPDITVHPERLTRPWHALYRFAFYPVLFIQGPFIKWNTVKLPEPTGPRAGVMGTGEDLSLLILGDSSAAGVGVIDQSDALSGQLATLLSDHVRLDWQLVARSGDTTPMALAHVKAAKPRPTDIAVLGLGVNDILHGTTQATWLKQTQDLLDYLTQDIGIGHVYVSGLPPVGQFPRLPNPLRWTLGSRAARFDRGLRKMLATQDNVTMVPVHIKMRAEIMSEDGFHPGPWVYAQWAQAIVARFKAHRGL